MKYLKYFLIVFGVIAVCSFQYLLWWNTIGIKNEVNANPSSATIIDPDKLMVKVNEWRLANNFDPYLPDQRVCNLAKIRAYEVDKNFSHDGFSSHSKDFYHNGISENISDGYNSESEIVQAWLASPTHKANLDKEYKYSCIACVTNTCAHIFANF